MTNESKTSGFARPRMHQRVEATLVQAHREQA
jgi:hypothetical protein